MYAIELCLKAHWLGFGSYLPNFGHLKIYPRRLFVLQISHHYALDLIGRYFSSLLGIYSSSAVMYDH